MRPNFFVLICLIATPALAAGKINYGSRVGMQVTVRAVSGIGTSDAQIKVEHTQEDAREFCVEYSNDRSQACVDRTIRETYINDILVGNCETGRFISLYGEKLRFVGPNKNKKEISDPAYLIEDEDGRALEGDTASGYFTDLGQFRALCPGLVDGSN